MCASFIILSSVLGLVSENLKAEAMSVIILPLALVDSSFVVDVFEDTVAVSLSRFINESKVNGCLVLQRSEVGQFHHFVKVENL